jgi:hypothetical protein
LIGFVYLRQTKIGVYRTSAVRSVRLSVRSSHFFYFHNYDARPLPTHVCLSSGEDRICHHWTRILCIYSAGVCPFDLVVSFKFGNHKSNVKSVEIVKIGLISFRPLLFVLPFSISFWFRWFRFASVGFVFISFSFRWFKIFVTPRDRAYLLKTMIIMYIRVPIKCETQAKRNQRKRNETKRNQQKRTETCDNFQFWPPSSCIAELFTYIPDE